MEFYSDTLQKINEVLWDIYDASKAKDESETIVSEPVGRYGYVTQDRFKVSEILKAGFSYNIFERLLPLMPFNLGDWSDILDIAPKTLARYKADNKTFRPLHAEKIIDMTEVTRAGLDFFENMADFKRWLRTPSVSFNKKAPIDLLTDRYGLSLVTEHLVRMEHGIFI